MSDVVDEPGDEAPAEESARDFENESDEELASVIRIGRNEDVATICGRVDTAPTFAVVIHAPDGNRSLSTELGIRRLQRHVDDAGKIVAIATTSVGLGSRARQAGIPVARRPEHVRWDAGGRRVLRVGAWSTRLPAVGRYVQYAIIAGFIVVMAVTALTLVPSGQVTAYPPADTLERRIVVTASPDRETIDMEQLLVPSRQVSATTELTLATRTTGRISVGIQPAVASISIANPGTNDVVIPAGSVLLTSVTEVEFQTDAEATVPAGKTVTVQASAGKPGTTGNLPAGAIRGFKDERYRTLRVTNPEPTSGGQNVDRQAVDAADITTLRNLARDLQRSEAIRRTVITARPHDAVFLRTAEATVTEGDPSALPGEEADVVLMKVKVTVTAQAILQETLEQVARDVLSQGQGEGEFLPGSVTAIETGARQANNDDGSIRTELLVRGEFARNVTRDAIRSAVRGKSPESARSTLLSRYGIEDADVAITPGFMPWLPRFDFRLEVDLRSRQAEEGDEETNGSAPGQAQATARP